MVNLDLFKLSKKQMNSIHGGRTWTCSGSNVDNSTAQELIFVEYDDIEAKDEFAAADIAKERSKCSDCYISCI